MKIGQIMTVGVKSCHPNDSLNTAAKIMWDHDCGCVPVEEMNKVVGMLTDRDVCMAAYTQGAPLTALKVADAMSKKVLSCHPDDTVVHAEKLMKASKVRRLPVIDVAGHLVGMLSLNDIVREAANERVHKTTRQISDQEFLDTVADICQPRSERVLAR